MILLPCHWRNDGSLRVALRFRRQKWAYIGASGKGEHMNLRATCFTLAILLPGIVVGDDVAARGHGYGHGGYHRGHARVGAFIAAPLFLPGYFDAPFYDYYFYNPPLLNAPAAPTTYIQQGAAPPSDEAGEGSWYYCADPQGYYPYVQQCPGGWQQVSPQPPAPVR
jgi:hypothetical protein